MAAILCAAVIAALLAPLSAADEGLALPHRALDVAFVGDGRVLVLMEGGLALYRHQPGHGFTRLDERPLPVTLIVRAPAGILLGAAGETAAWAATNQAEGAVLFSVEGDRLWEVQRAAALPWPDAPRGAAFRAGTNLVETEVRGLGPGPHLRVGSHPQSWAIASDGRLGLDGVGWTRTRVGSAAAALWPGAFVTTASDPPGARDAMSVATVGEDGSVDRVVAREVAGVVTAIAARPREDGALIVAAVSEGAAQRLIVIEVARVPR